MEENILSKPSTDREVLKFTRMFFPGAVDLQPDKQGRVVLPQNLRTYANITKDIIIAGMGERIEIWDKDRRLEWEKIYQEEDDVNWGTLHNTKESQSE